MTQPEDFLRLAETWIQGSTESEWRSAVSRAYYAAFHKGRLLLSDLGFQPPRGDQAHAFVWLRVSNCGDPTIQGAGSGLNALRRYRNLADYALEQDLLQSNARVHVRTARLIVQTLESAANEPTRTQVTDAIKIYERNVLRQVTWTP
jgi:uncharacterized protein (UPF0332 family)